MGAGAASQRDPADPAVRLQQRQERLGHGDGGRRDGPALQRPLRCLRDRVQRRRLHAAGDAAAPAGHARVRLRREENAGALRQRLFDVSLHRRTNARRRGRGRNRGCRRQPGARAADAHREAAPGHRAGEAAARRGGSGEGRRRLGESLGGRHQHPQPRAVRCASAPSRKRRRLRRQRNPKPDPARSGYRRRSHRATMRAPDNGAPPCLSRSMHYPQTPSHRCSH